MRLIAENGCYVRAEFGGGVDGQLPTAALNANKKFQSGWGTFKTEIQLNGALYVKTFNGHYVTPENGGGGPVSTNRAMPGPYEELRFVPLPGKPGEPRRYVITCHDGVHVLRLQPDHPDGAIDARGVIGMPGVVFLVQDDA